MMDENVRDGLANARVGFEKLKNLNQEIIRMSNRGQTTSHLTKEKALLEKNVIGRFKALRLARKSKNILTENQRAHWKYAANEVVGLLRTIRGEGLADIKKLEEKLQDILAILEKQSEETARLQVQLREQKKVSAKWAEENTKTTNEAAFLKEELERYRDRIVKLKKKLRQLQSDEGVVEAWSQEFDEEETTGPIRKRTFGQSYSGYGVPSGDSFILKAQLRDSKKRADNFERENDELKTKLKEFEQDMEEKESAICALELQLDETKDECRKLERKVKKLEAQVDAEKNGRPRPKEPGGKPDHFCPHCKCRLHYRSVTSTNWAKLIDGVLHTQRAAKKRKVEVIRASKGQEPETKADDTVDQDNEVLRFIDQCEMLTRDLELTEANLNKAYKEIDSLREENDILIGRLDKAETAVKQAGRLTRMGTVSARMAQQKKQQKDARNVGKKSKRATKGSLQSAMEEMDEVTKQIEGGNAYSDPYDKEGGQQKYDDQVEAMAVVFGKSKVTPEGELIPMKRVCGARMPKSKQLMAMIEDIYVIHRSDDGGARGPGSRGVAEPCEWIARLQRERKYSIAMAMIEGVQPEKVRDTATCTSALVERELERMTNDIIGFMEYTGTLMVQEGRKMSEANEKLRSKLSGSILRDVAVASKYEKRRQTPAQNDGDATGDDRTPPSASARGNFALAKSGKASKYAEKDVFLTLEQRNQTTAPGIMMGVDFGRAATTDFDSSRGYARSRFDWQQRSPHAQLTISGQQLVRMLTDTVNMLTENLRQQEHEYTVLHNAVKRQETKRAAESDTGPSMAPTEAPGVTKSATHASPAVEPSLQTSRSLDRTESDISEELRYLPPLLVHDGQKISNRDELKIMKTTVPRKGMIKLHAEGLTEDSEEDDSSKRRFRPAPLSHKKLMGKQRKLHSRAGITDTEEPTVDQLQKQILQFDDYMAAQKLHFINFGVSSPAPPKEYLKGKSIQLPPLGDSNDPLAS
ncbi:myosin-8-like [Ptychodera flava]|uniref:myosin-8-like n=1 Tax=Ptychodera flava TaxID=63121 RepID=UPI00396A2866